MRKGPKASSSSLSVICKGSIHGCKHFFSLCHQNRPTISRSKFGISTSKPSKESKQILSSLEYPPLSPSRSYTERFGLKLRALSTRPTEAATQAAGNPDDDKRNRSGLRHGRDHDAIHISTCIGGRTILRKIETPSRDAFAIYRAVIVHAISRTDPQRRRSRIDSYLVGKRCITSPVFPGFDRRKTAIEHPFHEGQAASV